MPTPPQVTPHHPPHHVSAQPPIPPRHRHPRRRRRSPLLRVVLTLLPLLAIGGPGTARAIAPTRILIGLAPGADFGDLAPLHTALGATRVAELPGTRIAIVSASRAALARYAAHPATRYAELDQPAWIPGQSPAELRREHQARAFGWRSTGLLAKLDGLAGTASPTGATRARAIYPNDPLFDLQWHHERIGSAAAWELGRAHEITIAVIDTGVECDHPDLEGVCVEGYDYLNDDPDPSDDNRHGTIEAGVAAAATNNARGVAGLAWGAKVMPLKAMGADGRGDFSAIIRSIEHAADHGAQVINMSLGASSGSQALQDAVAYAAGKGVFMAAAGGNGGAGLHYPAAYPEVVGVAGTKPDDSHPPFTTGAHIEIAAPGWDIQTTALTREGSYQKYHGTSEATPLVAGLAALLIEQNPDWSIQTLRQRIIDTAVDLGEPGWDEVFGWGRIDAGRAMDPDFVPSPPAPSPSPLPATPSPTPIPASPAPLYLPWLHSGADVARS